MPIVAEASGKHNPLDALTTGYCCIYTAKPDLLRVQRREGKGPL